MRALLPLLIALGACAPAADDDRVGPTDGADTSPPGTFTVAIIPDTQVYAEKHPEVFDRHMQWVAEHAEEWNIVFVSHVGDIVDNGDRGGEWDVADEAYAWVRDADIPHGLAVGNHDWDRDCPLDDVDCQLGPFLEHFGPSLYADRPWFRGSSPSGGSSYQIVEAEGLELLFLHLPHDVPQAEADWANTVLDQHPTALAHVSTHRYLYDYRLTETLPSPLDTLPGGRFNAFFYTVLGQGLRFEDSLSSDELFEQVIAPHPNVWTVHCGHVDAEFKQLGVNDKGLPVHEVLVDFQSRDDGGNGLLRLMRYTPEENLVEAFTVSTETGAFRENGEGFEHSIDLLERFADRGLAELEDLGFDTTELWEELAAIKVPGEKREAYRTSLYESGHRDSTFTLEVDFAAYTTP